MKGTSLGRNAPQGPCQRPAGLAAPPPEESISVHSRHIPPQPPPLLPEGEAERRPHTARRGSWTRAQGWWWPEQGAAEAPQEALAGLEVDEDGGGRVAASPSWDTFSASPATAAPGGGSATGLHWCFSTTTPGFNPTVPLKSWARLRILEASALLLVCPALDATPAPKGPHEGWDHSCSIFLS